MIFAVVDYKVVILQWNGKNGVAKTAPSIVIAVWEFNRKK